jgi:hypothetical protein
MKQARNSLRLRRSVLVIQFYHSLHAPNSLWVILTGYENRWLSRSNASVCGRSLAGITGSNPARGTDVLHLYMLCAFRYRPLRWADPSSRRDLPSVACLSDRENSKIRRSGPEYGCSVTQINKNQDSSLKWLAEGRMCKVQFPFEAGIITTPRLDQARLSLSSNFVMTDSVFKNYPYFLNSEQDPFNKKTATSRCISTG